MSQSSCRMRAGKGSLPVYLIWEGQNLGSLEPLNVLVEQMGESWTPCSMVRTHAFFLWRVSMAFMKFPSSLRLLQKAENHCSNYFLTAPKRAVEKVPAEYVG